MKVICQAPINNVKFGYCLLLNNFVCVLEKYETMLFLCMYIATVKM